MGYNFNLDLPNIKIQAEQCQNQVICHLNRFTSDEPQLRGFEREAKSVPERKIIVIVIYLVLM